MCLWNCQSSLWKTSRVYGERICDSVCSLLGLASPRSLYSPNRVHSNFRDLITSDRSYHYDYWFLIHSAFIDMRPKSHLSLVFSCKLEHAVLSCFLPLRRNWKLFLDVFESKYVKGEKTAENICKDQDVPPLSKTMLLCYSLINQILLH